MGGWKVTKLGGIAVAIMIAVWIAGIAYGDFNPNSVLGRFIQTPFGSPGYIFIVVVIFGGIAAFFEKRGRPFFLRGDDA